MGLIVEAKHNGDIQPDTPRLWLLSQERGYFDVRVITLAAMATAQEIISRQDGQELTRQIAEHSKEYDGLNAVPIHDAHHGVFVHAHQNVDPSVPQEKNAPLINKHLMDLKDTPVFRADGIAGRLQANGTIGGWQTELYDMGLSRRDVHNLIEDTPYKERITIGAYGITLEWPEDPNTPPTVLSGWNNNNDTPVVYPVYGREENNDLVIVSDLRQ